MSDLTLPTKTYHRCRFGIYVHIRSGDPLFASSDMFGSADQWPCFSRPIHTEFLREHDVSLAGMEWVEIRSRNGEYHLGYMYTDGRTKTNRRYLINGEMLKYISVSMLSSSGYAGYRYLFQKSPPSREFVVEAAETP